MDVFQAFRVVLLSQKAIENSLQGPSTAHTDGSSAQLLVGRFFGEDESIAITVAYRFALARRFVRLGCLLVGLKLKTSKSKRPWGCWMVVCLLLMIGYSRHFRLALFWSLDVSNREISQEAKQTALFQTL